VNVAHSAGPMTEAGLLITPTVAEAIAELEREQKQRDRVYPRLIAERKMAQASSDYRRACLNVAIAALRRSTPA
jgi:hypothetical protein